jgi:hypothetical protein
MFADVAMTRQRRRNAVGKDRKCSEAEISSQSRQGSHLEALREARGDSRQESKISVEEESKSKLHRAMLPSYTTNRFNGSRSYIPEYLRRIIHYPQMDIEYTFWFVPPCRRLHHPLLLLHPIRVVAYSTRLTLNSCKQRINRQMFYLCINPARVYVHLPASFHRSHTLPFHSSSKSA